MASRVEEVRRSIDDVDPLAADGLRLVEGRLEEVEAEVAAQLSEVEAAAAVRHNERLLTRGLLAILPVPLIATDTSGGVMQANAAAAELLGLGGGVSVVAAVVHRAHLLEAVS